MCARVRVRVRVRVCARVCVSAGVRVRLCVYASVCARCVRMRVCARAWREGLRAGDFAQRPPRQKHANVPHDRLEVVQLEHVDLDLPRGEPSPGADVKGVSPVPALT